jgi:hypothetical protein
MSSSVNTANVDRRVQRRFQRTLRRAHAPVENAALVSPTLVRSGLPGGKQGSVHDAKKAIIAISNASEAVNGKKITRLVCFIRDDRYKIVRQACEELGVEFVHRPFKSGGRLDERFISQTLKDLREPKDDGATIVQCIRGKDRTGFFVALSQLADGTRWSKVKGDWEAFGHNYGGDHYKWMDDYAKDRARKLHLT